MIEFRARYAPTAPPVGDASPLEVRRSEGRGVFQPDFELRLPILRRHLSRFGQVHSLELRLEPVAHGKRLFEAKGEIIVARRPVGEAVSCERTFAARPISVGMIDARPDASKLGHVEDRLAVSVAGTVISVGKPRIPAVLTVPADSGKLIGSGVASKGNET